MKYFAIGLIGLLCLLAPGCGTGPAHLDAFYSERNRYQTLIDDIERRYQLQSRDAEKGQVPALREKIGRLEKENEILKAQLEVLKEHSGPAK